MGVCMEGSISTREKCWMCGSKLVHDEKRHGLFCPKHPQVAAQRFIVRFPPNIFLNFRSYGHAAQQLSGLRYEKACRTLDPNDYRKDKPNGFRSLAVKYLDTKKALKSYRDIKRGINHAVAHFENINVKDITGGDIEDYLFGIKNISEKTRHNKKSNLSDFWRWLARREVIKMADMPMFPEIPFKLGHRTVTDWDTQKRIIAEIDRISKNPKVVFGVELLATYPALRPGDLLKITEENINLEYGEIIIHDPTKRKNQFKQILLIPEHIERFRQLKQKYPGVSKLKFFRHVPGVQSVKPDQPFGHKLFYKRWIRACQNLKIKGLDLYAGTRHTSITEIARRYGTSNAIKTSGHSTNKAFERYCRVQDHTALEMAKARAETVNGGGQVIRLRTGESE